MSVEISLNVVDLDYECETNDMRNRQNKIHLWCFQIRQFFTDRMPGCSFEGKYISIEFGILAFFVFIGLIFIGFCMCTPGKVIVIMIIKTTIAVVCFLVCMFVIKQWSCTRNCSS
ncbi:hypothetical protein NPIL_517491 [Nephila pilipes]|uniref:Uncharacterized protein n=1 Tax=Nephila pilipes TaxID=299642 RepID=A0A8X6QXW0_NEPPI|nr:hypothetical protein NPIL_517491 [Nephila pilipes]